ncbi:hypothetical protein Q8A73_007003 [Channa argus]|nr:hypothetical protein Q8A73_007003 [Channa argus]
MTPLSDTKQQRLPLGYLTPQIVHFISTLNNLQSKTQVPNEPFLPLLDLHGVVSKRRVIQAYKLKRLVCGSHSNDALSNVLTGTVVGKVETAFRSLTPITYSVQEDEGENIFLLSPLSGEFLLSRSLDFEAQRFYILTVAVQQGDSQVSSVRVYFNVLDVNDNPPVFSRHVFYAHLLEDAQVGTCFLSVNVSDKDDGDNGDLKLEVDRGNEDSVFFIDQAGRLCLNAELDRERQSSYNLTVTANDCVLPVSLQLSSTAHITVVVNDVNDNAPLFVSAKCVSLPEDTAPHSVVMTVQAEDEDAGSNGEVLYYLKNTSGGLFSIGETSGKIYLEEELDREEADTLTISVTATDRGSPRMTTAMNLTVHIEDVNDHDPEFSQSTYSFTVGEDTPRGTSVFQLQAHDLDIGTNGQIRYMLSQVGPFAVDVVRGIVTVMEQLDREKQSNYTLIVTAVDRGSVPRSTTAAVNVTVLDINDCTPLFSPQALIIHVMENEEDPSRLTHQVSALDEDLGANSQLTYSIKKGNGDGLFSITPNGTFKILHSLDREKESLFIITITAVDSGLPPLTGTLTVHIMVDDINDNHPEFTEDFYNTIVSEDSPTGTVFAMITASDIDEGVNGEIRYFMENPDVPFAIEETSGELFTTNALDRETVAVYRLTVVGSDKHPTQPLSSSVLVTVLIGDINDHWPQFLNSPYVAYVPDEMTPGLVVCAVRATDGDTEMNAELRYLLYGQSSDLFVIDPYSGTVFTSSATRRMEDIVVNVHVEDAGENPKFDIATISVRFQNISEFPEMNVDVLNHTLPEDEPVGTLVAVASALSFRAEPVSFYLASGNFEDTFHLEQSSGELTVENPLDHENKKEFTLLIEARDSGSPPFSSFTEIHLNISDINDNFPQFMQADYRCEVLENSPPSWVCDVLAIDADSDSYGTLRYNITEGNTDNFFTIDHENGYLSTTASLDRENISEYSLTVEAAELDNPIHKTKATVIILVLDRNDNAPRFSQIFLTRLPEDAPVGHSVIHISSNDDDTGVNAIINFSIIGQADVPFSIDFTSGDITVKRLLDREIQDHYTLKPLIVIPYHMAVGTEVVRLTAVDLDVSNSSANVEYVITGESDVTFSVPEDLPVGSVIGKIQAEDRDYGSNGAIMYYIITENQYLPFSVGESSGLLTLIIELDFEKEGVYHLQIKAVDGGWVSKTGMLNVTNEYMGFDVETDSGEIYTTSSLRKQGNNNIDLKVLAKNSGVITGRDVDEALVRISVIDTNDAPMFTSALYMANVTEDSPVGTSVITVSALDEDAIFEWNRFFFSIESGNTNFSFTVDSPTGVISVNSSLDRELWPVYNLTVTATDNGSPPSTGTANVIVTIGDVNDNAPKLTFTEIWVKENQPQGTTVAQLNASDSDLPLNQGPLTYWLVNPSAEIPFSLTPDGGLVTTRPIDREQISSYHILVAVGDAGTPALSSTTIFHVSIMDENDNPSLPRNIFIEVKYFGSSFQGGMIGNVHPEDPDASDTFTCTIKSGPTNMFMIPNGTCVLWSSPFQGEATFNITIEATDQLHFPVNNSIYINYKGFTNASIDNCILFYVSSSSMEEFLSYKYLKFVKALDSLFNLQASKTHVFGIKHIGREILLLAAVKNYHGQYLSREVASGISAGHKKLLEAQSNVTISHITTNPCLTSPCQNGAMCNKNIYISQDVAVLESLAVIFVSPQKEVLNCTCPVGFTGTLCEDEINECEVNPCENQGTCVNTAGSFYCQCQSGFHGPVCSPDVDECLKIKCQNGGTCIPTQDGFECQCAPGFEGKMCEQFIDHCRSAPCDRGSCINSHTGFSCYCPFGVSGVYCEEHSYGFEELSFMELPPLDRRTNLISLEFATVQSNSLLLYNPGELSSRDFFALEILDGVIHLTYDLGSGPVRLQTNKQVADGHFHSITVRRIGHMASLHVDNCADVGNNGFCFSQSDGDNSDRTLDVGNSNMTFGGLRTMEQIFLHPAQIQTHDFVGCIRNLYINGILLRHSMALATYNILDRCPRAAESPCHSNPCKNGGVCHDLWSNHLCECKGHFTGSNCEKEISEELVFRFNDNDYIEYVIKERLRRDHLLKHLLNDGKEGNNRDQTVINIKFKTKEDGVLMFVLRQAGYFLLKMEDRKLVYISEDTLTGVVSEFTVDSPVTDGLWHLLSMFSKGQNTFLHLDGKPVLNITGQNMDLTPVTVEKIILGAAVTSDSNLQHLGFSGCVQHFSVTSYTLLVSQHSVMVDVRPSSTLVQSSCSSPRVCLPSPCSEEDSAQKDCLSAHCQNRWRCRAAVQNHSCICLHNVSNYICDICMSTAEGRDHCYEEQGSLPQWLIAVILPLISILLIIFVILFRVRQQAAKCQSDSLPEKKDQGTDNVTFCFDNIRSLTNIAPAEMDKCDPVGADEQSQSEFYSNANLASVQLVQNSELEYCEIGSISSAFHSETASPKLDWHKLYYSTKCGRDYSKQWENLKMLLAGFHIERSSKEMPKSPAKPQNVAFLNTQVLPEVGADQFQHTPPCYTKTFLQPELLEHVQCLTFEEIGKLNTPPEQAKPHQASLRSEGNHKSTTMIYASSDSETDSTFTCSESEYRQFSMTREHLHDQLSLSACSFTQKDNLPTNNTLFEHNFNSDAAQYKAESTFSGVFAQWERLLNMHLPFSSYAPVFEDIACLPMEPSHSYDMQSDIEEII